MRHKYEPPFTSSFGSRNKWLQKDMPTQPLDTWSPRRAESIQAVANCNSSDWGSKARFPFTCNHSIAICCMQKLVALPAGETAMAGNDTISNGMLLLLKQTRWKSIRTKQKNNASTGPTKRAQEEAWCRGWKAKRRRQPATKRQALHGERRNQERQTRRNQLQEISHMNETQERATNARVRSHAKKHGGRTMWREAPNIPRSSKVRASASDQATLHSQE